MVLYRFQLLRYCKRLATT